MQITIYESVLGYLSVTKTAEGYHVESNESELLRPIKEELKDSDFASADFASEAELEEYLASVSATRVEY